MAFQKNGQKMAQIYQEAAFSRWIKRVNWSLWSGIVLVIGVVILAIRGPALSPHDPLQQNQIVNHEGKWYPVPLRAFEVPDFPLGSDQFGRDLLSQLLWAVRPTMVLVTLVATIRLLLGIGIGLFAGWKSDLLGRLLDSVIAAAISVPVLIVSLGMIALIGVDAGLTGFIVGLCLSGWADTARIVRTSTRQIRGQLYVEAAHSLGASDAQILFRHVLRQVMPMGWMLFAFEISTTLMVTAGLGFLGYYIGGDVFIVTTDTAVSRTSGLPELGQMLATSWISLTEPWGLFSSGIMVLFIVLAFNLLGQGLRNQFQRTTRTGLLTRLQDRFGVLIEEYITYPIGLVLETRPARILLGALIIAAVTSASYSEFILKRGSTQPVEVVLTVPGGHLWGSERHDPYGTLWTPAIGPETADVAWRFVDPTGFTGGIAIDSFANLYFSSQANRLYSLSPEGQVRWYRVLPFASVGGPALNSDGQVFVTDVQGGLSAFTPTGEPVWRYEPGTPTGANSGPIVSPDGVIYYAVGSRVHAVSSMGERLWIGDSANFNLSPTPPRLSPDGKTLLLDDVALSVEDGSKLDYSVIDEAAEGTNTQFARLQYVVDPSGHAYLASRSVAVQWSSGENGLLETGSRITWDPNLTVFGDPADIGITPTQVVWRVFTANIRFDTILQWIDADGVALGNVQFSHRPSNVMAVDGDDTLYTCGPDRAQNNRLGCVSWSKGAESANWTLTLERPFFPLAGALVDGRLYVVTAQGTLLAIGKVGDQEMVLEAPPYETVSGPAGENPGAGNGVVGNSEGLASFVDFLDLSYAELLLRDPETITELGLSESYGYDERTLTDVSPTFQRQTVALAQQQLTQLHGYDLVELTPEDQISYSIYEWYLQDIVDSGEFLLYDYPYNHLFGWHQNLMDFMLFTHPLATFENIKTYYIRLGLVNQKVDQMIAFMAEQRSAGIVPPQFMLEYALAQTREYTEDSAENHVLLDHYQAVVGDNGAFTDSQKNKFYSNAITAINQNVLVGYRKLAQYFEGFLAEVETDHGFSAHPNGEAAYQFWLRHHTTTDLTAEEIHQLGLREVERITSEMDILFLEAGIEGDSMNEKMTQVAVKSGFIHGEDAVVAEYNRVFSLVESDFSDYFEIWSPTPLEVIPFSSSSAPGAYYVHPAFDGSRPGRFFVNLDGGQAIYGIPTLAYHEGLPGHHHQIALQGEIDRLPNFRNGVNFSAFAEGWALYAEFLAYEAGVYDDDPLGNLGRLQGELFRAARLVVDTGLHAFDWPREKAVEYMVATVGYSSRAMGSEVDRYLVWPGQATAYKVGMLKILELRGKAQESLGDSFEIIEFHNLILENGGMPLEVLEEVVDRWIESQSGG